MVVEGDKKMKDEHTRSEKPDKHHLLMFVISFVIPVLISALIIKVNYDAGYIIDINNIINIVLIGIAFMILHHFMKYLESV